MITNRLITIESPMEFYQTNSFNIVVSELSCLDISSLIKNETTSNYMVKENLQCKSEVFLAKLQDELIVFGDDKLSVDITICWENRYLVNVEFKIRYVEKNMPIIRYSVSGTDNPVISMQSLFEKLFARKYFCNSLLCQQSMVNLNHVFKLFNIEYDGSILLGIDDAAPMGSYFFNTYSDELLRHE